MYTPITDYDSILNLDLLHNFQQLSGTTRATTYQKGIKSDQIVEIPTLYTDTCRSTFVACATTSRWSYYSLENCFRQVHGAVKKIIRKNAEMTTSFQTVFTS